MKTILAVSVMVCAAGAALAVTRRPPEKKERVCPIKKCEISVLKVRWIRDHPPSSAGTGDGAITIDTADRDTVNKAIADLKEAVKNQAGESDDPCGKPCQCVVAQEIPNPETWVKDTARVPVIIDNVTKDASFDYEISASFKVGVCARRFPKII